LLIFLFFSLLITLFNDGEVSFKSILLNGIVTVIRFFSIFIDSLPYTEIILGTPLPDLSEILSCKKRVAKISFTGKLDPL